ncbi:hypothetical protein C6P42_003193 [Pichia californica]|nr:hypothetical protein C6P42_003193 [[Candida] californica]
MTNTYKYIVKTSKKLASYSFFKNKKSNGYIPKRINLKVLETSPVFKNPQKWISKFKYIDESERIQSYKPLENSCISTLLASPPRMTHATRTVVPRDFLLPFRVMKNPLLSPSSQAEIESTTNSKLKPLKYIVAPFHPGEKKIPEDPVAYYPRKQSIFKNYANNTSDKSTTIPLKKLSIIMTAYPNITDWKSVGWNINTGSVVEKIHFDQLMDALNNVNSWEDNQTNEKLRFIHDVDTNEFIGINDNIVTINMSIIAKFNPTLASLLKEKFPKNYIPNNKHFTNVVNELMKYCILIDSTFL